VAFIYREWRTLGAAALAAAMIAGAFLLARAAERPARAQAESDTALLAQIASRDSTGDGLPDWEKPLYGIPLDATTTDYFHLGMTDGEAAAQGLIVPRAPTLSAPAATTTPDTAAELAAAGISGVPGQGSLTDAFAKNFFGLYLSAAQQAGGSLTSDQINQLAEGALDQLSSSIAPAPDFKTAAELTTSGAGPAALARYAASAEAIVARYDPRLPKSQLDYLEDYLSTGDPDDLASLATIAAFYQNAASALAALPAPEELAATHLALVNALARTGEEIGDFSRTDRDPLAAMIALGSHGATVRALAEAFTALKSAYAAEGAVPAPGAPGASFVGLMDAVAAQGAQTP
jgi:hypothetical protein